MQVSETSRVALVSGAAGGIGRAIITAFIQMEYRVGACDVNAERINAMENEFGRDALLAFAGDISDPPTCRRFVKASAERFGAVHVLINNAALGMNHVSLHHFTQRVQVEDINVDMWSKMVAVNFNAPFFMAKAMVPIFRRQRWGRIINVTTSFFTMLNPGFAPYGPSKAAMEAWSACLAGELADSGITVNVVVPGGPTDRPHVPLESDFSRASLIAPDVMAPPIMWLCSDEAASVTGQRVVAAQWESPASPKGVSGIGWPDLARQPVWLT